MLVLNFDCCDQFFGHCSLKSWTFTKKLVFHLPKNWSLFLEVLNIDLPKNWSFIVVTKILVFDLWTLELWWLKFWSLVRQKKMVFDLWSLDHRFTKKLVFHLPKNFIDCWPKNWSLIVVTKILVFDLWTLELWWPKFWPDICQKIGLSSWLKFWSINVGSNGLNECVMGMFWKKWRMFFWTKETRNVSGYISRSGCQVFF